MPGDHLEPPSVGPFSAAELPDALQLLFSNLDAGERPLRTAELLADINAPSGKKNHIPLAARRRQTLVAVVWLQIRPGNVAVLHSLGLAPSEPEKTVIDLVNLAVTQATLAGVQFVQTLLNTDAGAEALRLQQCRFQHLTDLLYLVSPHEAFPTEKPSAILDFQPLDESAAAMARLAAILEQTYQGSQDCPAIHGLQPIGDALASYRATGQFDPSSWFIVRHDSADIGCVLLTEHPMSSSLPIPQPVPARRDSPFPTGQWELIYMGLIPAARGNGWGIEIVRHAQWLTGQGRAQRLNLAVDAANAPAIRVYSAAGFETWDRRSVFLRTK